MRRAVLRSILLLLVELPLSQPVWSQGLLQYQTGPSGRGSALSGQVRRRAPAWNLAAAEEAIGRLRDLRRSCRKISMDTEILANDLVGKQPVHILSPNSINALNGVQIPPIPLPQGTIDMPRLPEQQKPSNACLADLGDVLRQVRQDVAAISMPRPVAPQVAADWKTVLALTDGMVRHYNTLVKLSSHPQAGVAQLGKEILKVHDEADAIKAASRSVSDELKAVVRAQKEGSKLAGR